LYEDKVFVATTDAHLAALDARSAKPQESGDGSKGHNQTGGVMVIHGKVLVGLTGLQRVRNGEMCDQRLRR